MQKQPTKKRKGDTGRTSNQGRKLSSGGTLIKKKGNPDIDEDTKMKLKKSRKLRVPAKVILR